MNSTTILLVMGFLFACGCASSGRVDTSNWESAKPDPRTTTRGYTFWDPSEVDKTHAEVLARKFAHQKLRLAKEYVGTMKPQFLATYRNGGPVLVVDFFDPKEFRKGPTGHYWPVLGGFPHYFSVSVDPIKWRVIGHQASDE